MTARITTIVVDCNDIKRATTFWSHALGYDVDSTADSWVNLVDPKKRAIDVALQPTTDKKGAGEVNRLHIDLVTEDVAAEVKRLEKLGAKRADWKWYTTGAKYVVMHDTEGNEFCVCPT
jgi:predicted enzyme related to lactoylglutathione lyase